MSASYYRSAPPPSSADSAATSSSSYPHYSTPPPPSLPPPAQPYSHPHNPHSYHIQHPPLNPIPSVVTFDYASLPSSFAAPPPGQDQLRTLFIAGLPDDTKPREIYNLFREFPGYESSSVRVKSGSTQAYAFAVFSDQHSAVTALHALNGIKFDLDRDSTLHIELAKSNSKGKRPRGDDDSFFPHHATKYSRGENHFGAGSNMNTSGHALHSLSDYPSAPRSSSLEPPPPPGTDNRKVELRSSGVTQENPPCPTLYVTNLGPTCTDDELAQFFMRLPGFLKHKLQRRRGLSAAFVDFKDEESATAALLNLQGTMLHSSTEGMCLEYAKSRMGARKQDRR